MIDKKNKNKLVRDVWSKDDYYRTAGQGSMDVTHPAMKKLKDLARSSVNILDMGCGEGTRLAYIADNDRCGFGIDISEKAIEIARKKYPQFDFRVGDLENLPFSDNKFDLVYSAFTFEHLDNPEKVLMEAIRVLKKGGALLIVAPNFGAPNRASPPNKKNRLIKLLAGLAKDMIPSEELNWQKVEPIASDEKYEIDWDTTVEPYLGSLIKFFKKQRFKVLHVSSVWEKEEDKSGAAQRIFGLLGKKGIYPFKYWGPHLVIVAEK